MLDPELGRELARNGLRDIGERFGSWDASFSQLYQYFTDPEGRAPRLFSPSDRLG